MQQTAIDYLMKQIGEGKIQSTYTKCGYLIEIHDDVLEIAKEMEKNQIIQAFDIGTIDVDIIGKEYYNKIYNNGQDT